MMGQRRGKNQKESKQRKYCDNGEQSYLETGCTKEINRSTWWSCSGQCPYLEGTGESLWLSSNLLRTKFWKNSSGNGGYFKRFWVLDRAWTSRVEVMKRFWLELPMNYGRMRIGQLLPKYHAAIKKSVENYLLRTWKYIQHSEVIVDYKILCSTANTEMQIC